MPSNYNKSAWFYDKLSRLVYGKALINAQVYLLQFVPPGSHVLIAGGGTGRILEDMTEIYPSGLQITYVEIAADMIARSNKRNIGDNKVVLINAAIENVLLPPNFDVIITPFLFDNFRQETLDKIFPHMHGLLKAKGLWLNADFQLTGKWWQKILLKSMFLFFKIICQIEASRLPDIEKQFEQRRYELIEEKTFFGDFVIASVYKKDDQTYEGFKTS